MRVVVTGGTGLIGRQVVQALLAKGVSDIVATSRDPGRHSSWSPRVSLVQAFAGDALSLGKALTGADVVVHTIQFPNHPVEDPSRGRTYMEVDGRGTALAAAVAKSVGVRRFVYLSGAGTGQGRSQSWFRAKDQAEEAIRGSGLQYAMLRPSWIYGPGDRSMSRFIFFCRYLPIIPVIGDGTTPVYPISVKDVAASVVECVLREDCKEKTLDLPGPERLTMDEVVRTIQKVLHRRRPILHQPVWMMKLLTRPLQLLPNPPLSPGAVDFVTQAVEMDGKAALEYLGLRFRTLEHGLEEYL